MGTSALHSVEKTQYPILVDNDFKFIVIVIDKTFTQIQH